MEARSRDLHALHPGKEAEMWVDLTPVINEEALPVEAPSSKVATLKLFLLLVLFRCKTANNGV